MNTATPELVIFYDGQCPLCAKEMAHLHALDNQQRLKLVDIYSGRFRSDYPEMQNKPVLQLLHAYLYLPNSEKCLLTGLDVTYHAWRCVGRGWIVKPLRWPLLRYFADAFYLWFAKHRFTISYLLTGKTRCQTCSLEDKS